MGSKHKPEHSGEAPESVQQDHPETEAESSQAPAQQGASPEPAEATQENLAELKKELEKARAKADENWEKVLLVSAEMENLRRRTQKDLENATRFALEKFSKELLQVVDSLEIGLKTSETDSVNVESIRHGMELTLKQFLTVLNKFNVAQIDPQGQPFNPEQHQAMTMQPSEDAPPNTVLQVFQKGYELNGRLIRPAMVVVSQAVEPKPEKKIDEQA